MTTVKYTPSLIPIADVGQPITFPSVWAKLVPLERVLKFNNEFVTYVANTMYALRDKRFKYALFDVKDQCLEKGQNPCLGFWHCDSSLNAGPIYENFYM